MGGGHGDHGHHSKPYEVPDWRQYKVEDVEELMVVKRCLAQKGLKDPWLRNEVWRYHPGFGTFYSRTKTFVFRGFKWGFLAFVATVAGEKIYDKYYGGNDDHHHHHNEHH